MHKEVLIIGPGKIGNEYSRILTNMRIKHRTLGRVRKNKFREFVLRSGPFTHAILSTPPGPMVEIYKTLRNDLDLKIPILAEKPFSYDLELITELQKVDDLLFVALNRRYYSTTIKIKKLIENKEIHSMHFDFSEKVETWRGFLADKNRIDFRMAVNYQSIHLIDLAFFFMGIPISTKFQKIGQFNKYGKGKIVGHGQSSKGTLFTFQSNWQSPGNWKIDFATADERIIMNPIESPIVVERSDKSKIKNTNSKRDSKFLNLEEIDLKFKPGFYKQTQLFLNNEYDSLVGLREYLNILAWIKSTID